MKTLKTVSLETKSAIQKYIDLSEKFKNAYFWSAPKSASDRRRMESQNSFIFNCDGVELSFCLEVSCKNIYVRKQITIDGLNKNLASLKKLL